MKKKPVSPQDRSELRRLAEALLNKVKHNDQNSPEVDALVLLNELQVHQIELELQNEELIQTREKLEEALRLYTDLYDFSPVGYLTLAGEGTIIRCNLAVSYLFNVERETIINQRLGLYISPQSQTAFQTFIDKIFTSGDKETCEVTLVQKSESPPVYVHMEGIIEATYGQGKACRLALVDISKRKQTEDLLRERSTHDILTGLYNRNFFMAELTRFERGRNYPVSIVMADVDQLKHTNDHHGHAAGDLLLKRFAEVLTTAFRSEDVVARIGGDEFAVLLPNTNASAAKISIRRVQNLIQQFNKDQKGTPIQASLGVSTATVPGPLEPVLHEADQKMYLDKRRRNSDKTPS